MAAAAGRVSLLKPTAVNSILAEVRALQAQGRTPVSLMRGEPDFATPDHIVEAAARALRSGRTKYPDNRGEIALREAVAAKLETKNSLLYDPAVADTRHRWSYARTVHGADGDRGERRRSSGT